MSHEQDYEGLAGPALPMKYLLPTFLLLGIAAPARAEVSFTRDLAPVLMKRCVGCHGERVGLAGYRAHTFQAFMRPGASKAPAVVAGNPDKSRLFHLLVEKSPAKRMPKSDDPLSPAQVQAFRQWIREGAKFDGKNAAAPLNTLLGPREHPAAPAAYRAPVPVFAVALSPGGQEVFAGGYHEVTVWDASTGKLLRRLGRLPQRIQSLAFSPDGKSLLLAGGTPGEYGEVALLDPTTGQRRVLDTWGDIVLAASFSRDGSRVAAGAADAAVRVYETATGKQLWNSRVHSDWVTGVSFSADGKFLASSGKDMAVKVYDAATGALFTTYNGHNRNYGKYRGQFPVYAVLATPDLFVSAGGGKTVQFWDPARARDENGTAADMEERFFKESHARHIEHGFAHEVYGLALSGDHLFAASSDGVLRQFDLKAGKEVRSYTGHADWIFALSLDTTGQRAVTADYAGVIKVWDTRTGQCTATFRGAPGASQ